MTKLRYKSIYEAGDDITPEEVEMLKAKGSVAIKIRDELERITGLDQEKIILFLEGRTSKFTLDELSEIWERLQQKAD